MISLNEVMISTNQELLKKVIEYKNPNYRLTVAKNPNISESIMYKLIDYDTEDIIVAVASNKNITFDIANIIYSKNYFYALESLSKNVNCPVDILDKLGDNIRFYINLFDNPSTPIDTIKRILDNSDKIDFCFDILIRSLMKRSDVDIIKTKYELILRW